MVTTFDKFHSRLVADLDPRIAMHLADKFGEDFDEMADVLLSAAAEIFESDRPNRLTNKRWHREVIYSITGGEGREDASDKELLAVILTDDLDVAAFGELCARYASEVLAVVHRYLSDDLKEEAADICEAFWTELSLGGYVYDGKEPARNWLLAKAVKFASLQPA